jgi:signal transduction histidine kinase
LRRRLFITIFSVLCLTAISISSIHYYFFKLERLRLIELNLQQNISLLENSDLTLSKKEFSVRGREFVDEIIGNDKINMIVGIYNHNGNILYKNNNAQIFDLPNSIQPNFQEWEDVESKDYFIKYLTVKDSSQDRIIRVGLILNQSLLRWKDLNQRIFVYGGIILSVITLLSFFLTFMLFKPVHILAEQVNLMAEKIEQGEFDELKSWFHLLKTKSRSTDEFQSLIGSLDKLAHKITDNQTLTQKWSALMAHELKTPMTLLRMSMDHLIEGIEVSPKKIEAVESDMTRLEEIIMDFLEWASAENDTSKPELHMIPVDKKTKELIQHFSEAFPETKVSFSRTEGAEYKLFCHPIHFEQVVNNLLTNAVKYAGGEMTVTAQGNHLTFSDKGPGIPGVVQENFGKPFNKYTQGQSSGHGLGLAWVNTIAKKYSWRITLTSNTQGATFKISFPDSES